MSDAHNVVFVCIRCNTTKQADNDQINHPQKCSTCGREMDAFVRAHQMHVTSGASCSRCGGFGHTARGCKAKVARPSEDVARQKRAAEVWGGLFRVSETSCSRAQRDAFMAVRVEGMTLRAAEAITGVSKSHVKFLADQFQGRVARQVRRELKNGETRSDAFWNLCRQYLEASEASRIDEFYGSHTIGHWHGSAPTREDWAEMRGQVAEEFE